MKSTTKFLAILLVVATLFLSACDFLPQSGATYVEIINGDYSTIGIGDNVELFADTDGKTPIEWKSDDETVATIDINGVVHGIAEGFAIITASCDHATDTIVVTVTDQNLVISLTAPQSQLAVGESMSLQASVTPAQYQSDVVISVTDGQGNATIDGNILTGTNVGSATVVASVNNVYSNSVVVQVVKAGSVTSLQLQADKTSAVVGSRVSLGVTNLTTEQLSGVTYKVLSGNATVDADGIVGNEAGTVTVAATYDGVVSNVVMVVFVSQESLPESVQIFASDNSLFVDETCTFSFIALPQGCLQDISYQIVSGNQHARLSGNLLTALSVGEVQVVGEICGVTSQPVTVTIVQETDPYSGVSSTDFYRNYTEATSYKDSYYRTLHNFMSGSIQTQSKKPTESSNKPSYNGTLLKNTNEAYADGGNSYTVLDANGNTAFTVYKGGAYVTAEQVAAYVTAFGNIPANYDSDKDNKNSAASPWGKYLRLNHAKFYGDTDRYPNEPELPDISGCGGSTTYYEMDVGLSGYNNGSRIVRGTARIVYSRIRQGKYISKPAERHVFYTYNHYEDFQEYLNYEGGWGHRFGYETGNSKSPTAYVNVLSYDFSLGTSSSQIANYFGK